MKIFFSLISNRYITLSYSIQDKVHSFVLDETQFPVSNEYLVAWLLAKTRPVFRQLPISKPSFSINQALFDKWSVALNIYSDIFKKTNNLLSEYLSAGISSKRRSPSESKNIIVFKVDNQRYNNLFGSLKLDKRVNVIELYEPTNWDGLNRCYEDKPPTYSIRDILQIVLDNQVSKLVSVNLQPLVKYMWREHLNIFVILDYLGVTLYRIQNDPSELVPHGYLLRELADYDMHEFIFHQVLSSEYDSRSSSVTFPTVILQDYSNSIHLAQNYVEIKKVVVISNSRFDQTSANSCLYKPILDNLNNPILELPLWYLSISRLLDRDNYLSETQKYLCRSHFHWCFYYAAQYLKYQIINSISSSINLSVFGDIGWSNVCPDHYGGYLDIAKIDQVLGDKSNLVLLLNFGYSYLEHSGPVYDVIRSQCNWLNVPSVVTTPELEGLKNLEYTSYADLHRKITSYHDFAPAASDSRLKLASILQSSTDHFFDSLSSSTVIDSSTYLFHNSFASHAKLLDSRIDSYISANIDTLLSQIYSRV